MTRSRAVDATVLPLLSGVLVGLTFTPLGGPVLPFVAFAPALVAVSRRDLPGVGLRSGFLVGFTAHAIGLFWMVPALSWRSGLAVPTYLLVLCLIGIGSATVFEGALRLHRRSDWPLPLTLAVCWVAFEWAAARVPGLSYAWLNVGGSLAWYPTLAAPAAFFGGGVLTLWTVTAGATFGSLLAGSTRRSWAHLGFAGLLAVPLGAGWWSQGEESSGPPITVVAVQAGRNGTRDDPGPFGPWVDSVRRFTESGGVDLVVFPERFLGYPPRSGLDGDAFAAAVGVPVLFGAPSVQANGSSGDSTWFNAAFLVTPGDPQTQVMYKSRLVPGLEDGGSPFASLLGLPTRGYRYGTSPVVIQGPSGPIGVLICYDSSFPGLARTLVAAGAELLIVISNDDWMDPAKPERVTWAYWQHETQARLRAVENRVSVVQVATTGFTFVVDPLGRGGADDVGAPGPEPFERTARPLLVQRAGQVALFTRTGDVLGVLCFGVWILALVPPGLLKRFRGDPFHG